MKPSLMYLLLVAGSVALSTEASAQQNCFYAVVLSPTSVELHMRCSFIAETNQYGLYLQRRNENDPIFSDLWGSFCARTIQPDPYACIFVDSTVTPGIWHCRVKLVDLDGSVSFPVPPIRVIVNTTQVVYPLHIGNRWNWGYERKITGDTLMPNGKRYAKLYDPVGIQRPYQRYEAGKVYASEFRGSIDQVIFDFTKLPGDTIATIYRSTDTMDIILSWQGETSLFGRMRRQWGFWFDVRRMIDEELYQVVTDSIGVTHEAGMWFSANLLGAIINGTQYGTITSISQLDQPTPTEFHLYQNYPNPFNPTTEIRYQMSEGSRVTLKVFDLLGREVATLVDETRQSGEHSVQFDGNNLTSGIYFYRLSVNGRLGSHISAKKMMLIR